jgi:GxxExxY protein
MPTKKAEILYKDLSYKIVGLGMQVHSQLGCGFLEKIYEKAMLVLLEKEGIPFRQQVPHPVYFEGRKSGNFYTDIVVDGKIILELKAADAIADVHRAQALNYLNATGLQLAIVMNFGKPRLQVERLVF